MGLAQGGVSSYFRPSIPVTLVDHASECALLLLLAPSNVLSVLGADVASV